MTGLNTLVIDDTEQAAEIIRLGGLVAFPTETVFGLGVDATNSKAIAKLFAAKGRPSDNPLIVHVAEVAHWPRAASELTEVAQRLLAQFSPGPLTVVLPKHESISLAVTAGLDTVGLRIPKHELARQLLSAAGVPVAAPSANRSGRPSGTTWQTVFEDLDGRIDAVLIGETCEIGIESTVVDCVSQPPRLLRPGAVSLHELQLVAPELIELDTSINVDAAANSPGLRHPHYQPSATVYLVDSAREAERIWALGMATDSDHEELLTKCAYCGLDEPRQVSRLGASRRFVSVEQYAQELFEFMRVVDRLGIQRIYCQRPSTGGIGIALLDRLNRAAS